MNKTSSLDGLSLRSLVLQLRKIGTGLLVGTALIGSFEASAQNTFVKRNISEYVYMPASVAQNGDPNPDYYNKGAGAIARDKYGNYYFALHAIGVIYKKASTGDISVFAGKHGVCGHTDSNFFDPTQARFTFYHAAYTAVDSLSTLTSQVAMTTDPTGSNLYVGDGGMIFQINVDTHKVTRIAGVAPLREQFNSKNPGEDCTQNAMAANPIPINPNNPDFSVGSLVVPKYEKLGIYYGPPGTKRADSSLWSTATIMSDFMPAPTIDDLTTGTSTRFLGIADLAVDPTGTYLYVLDMFSDRPLRRVKLKNFEPGENYPVETILQVAPTFIWTKSKGGTTGQITVNQAKGALMSYPAGMVFDKTGAHIYIADTGLCRILDFNLSAYLTERPETPTTADIIRLSPKYLSTLAGVELTNTANKNPCSNIGVADQSRIDYSQDSVDGPLNQATIGYGIGRMAIDTRYNDLYFSESRSQKLRKISLNSTNQTVDTVYSFTKYMYQFLNQYGLGVTTSKLGAAFYLDKVYLFPDMSNNNLPPTLFLPVWDARDTDLAALKKDRLISPIYSFILIPSKTVVRQRRLSH